MRADWHVEVGNPCKGGTYLKSNVGSVLIVSVLCGTVSALVLSQGIA